MCLLNPLQDKVVICKRQIILICAGTVATTYILPFHSLWNFNDSFAYSIVICYFLIKCNSKKYCKCQSNQCNTYRCDKDRFVAFFMCHTQAARQVITILLCGSVSRPLHAIAAIRCKTSGFTPKSNIFLCKYFHSDSDTTRTGTSCSSNQ